MVTICVIDTETGGLDPAEHCIIEIAARVVRVTPDLDVRGFESFEARITPDRPVDPRAAAVNGYAPDTWGGELPLVVLARFTSWVERHAAGALWGGCNPSFDRAFVMSDCKWHGLAPPNLHYRSIDVESLALPYLAVGDCDGTGLRHLRALVGISDIGAHTARGDVEDTCIALAWLLSGACVR